MPKAGFQKGKRKDGTEENLKKWALSFNLQLLSGKRQNHKFLKEIKSNLSPHKESFTVKGKKILLFGKCKLLPNFRLKNLAKGFWPPCVSVLEMFIQRMEILRWAWFSGLFFVPHKVSIRQSANQSKPEGFWRKGPNLTAAGSTYIRTLLGKKAVVQTPSWKQCWELVEHILAPERTFLVCFQH